MEKCTMQDVKQFCEEHSPQRMTIMQYIGADDHYIMTFESGDTYEYHAHGDGWKKTVHVILNGQRENVTEYEYHNFGWREIA